MCISGTFLLLSPNQTLSSGFVRLWVLFAFISPTSSICTTYIMWYYMYIHIIIKSHYHKILQMCIKIMHQVYIHIYIYMTFYIHIYIILLVIGCENKATQLIQHPYTTSLRVPPAACRRRTDEVRRGNDAAAPKDTSARDPESFNEVGSSSQNIPNRDGN